MTVINQSQQVSQVEPELDTAQPQLVSHYSYAWFNYLVLNITAHGYQIVGAILSQNEPSDRNIFLKLF